MSMIYIRDVSSNTLTLCVDIVQDQGNDALKRGLQLKKKFYLREALNLYTKGLEMGSTLPGLLSALHSNRAQAHLLLENYRRALEDSLAATRPAGNKPEGTYFPCTSDAWFSYGSLLELVALNVNAANIARQLQAGTTSVNEQQRPSTVNFPCTWHVAHAQASPMSQQCKPADLMTLVPLTGLLQGSQGGHKAGGAAAGSGHLRGRAWRLTPARRSCSRCGLKPSGSCALPQTPGSGTPRARWRSERLPGSWRLRLCSAGYKVGRPQMSVGAPPLAHPPSCCGHFLVSHLMLCLVQNFQGSSTSLRHVALYYTSPRSVSVVGAHALSLFWYIMPC